MKLVETNLEDLVKKQKKVKRDLKLILLEFIKSDLKFAKVVDNENEYYNNNDLRRTLDFVINKNGYDKDVNVFLLNGEVYLKRK